MVEAEECVFVYVMVLFLQCPATTRCDDGGVVVCGLMLSTSMDLVVVISNDAETRGRRRHARNAKCTPRMTQSKRTGCAFPWLYALREALTNYGDLPYLLPAKVFKIDNLTTSIPLFLSFSLSLCTTLASFPFFIDYSTMQP